MKKPKLERKAIRWVLQIYILVFVFSILLCVLFIAFPLSKNVINEYSEQNQYILDQVDTQLDTVREYANYIAYSEDFMEKLNRYTENSEDIYVRYELEQGLYGLRNLKSGIKTIVVEAEGKAPVSSIIELEREEKKTLKSEWYKKIRNSHYSAGFSNGICMENGGQRIRVLAYSKSYHFKNQKFTLTLFFKYNDLLGNNMRYYHKLFEKQFWTDLEGNALFSDEQKELDELIKDYEWEGLRIQKGREGLLIRSELQNATYNSIAYVPNSVIYQEIWKTGIIIILMAVLLLVGILIVVIRIVKHVTKPVYQLARAMDQVVADNFTTKLPVDRDDEIGELSQTFNSMSEKLQEYFRQLVERMNVEQEMKFGLLISQIDPHFVCNTLNTVKYLAVQNRLSDVIVVASALSSILRDRLRVKNFQIYDTVEQEMETIRQYLTIQNYRYGGEVQVLWEVDSEAKQCQIPKNMIQPLVENALFHGLSSENDGSVRGKILIHISKREKIYIRVRDNGNGITEEKIHVLLDGNPAHHMEQSGHGIGIYNIRERLELLYGEKAEFHIRSQVGAWTEIEIVIDCRGGMA